MYLIFADIKIYRAINFPKNRNLLASNTDSIRAWCTAKHMKLTISKTNVTSFLRKVNIRIYEYTFCQSSIT
jgi:hypothetical protein